MLTPIVGELHIGFSGTRHGMTSVQLHCASAHLESLPDWLHHGDCIGADQQMHHQAYVRQIKTAIHPPTLTKYRAFCRGVKIYPEKDYLARNRDIVNMTNRLIIAPNTMEEEKHSGTWYTYRYAKKNNKPVTIIFPDGSVRVKE